MRFYFSGPRIGPIRPGVSFNAGSFRRVRSRGVASGQFVYVIEGSHGAVKIGISVDPPQRRKELQTGTPHHLFLAFSIWGGENAFDVEQEAHAILDAHRMPGEWFAVSKEMAIAAVYGAASRLSVALGEHPPEIQRTSFLDSIAWPWKLIAVLIGAGIINGVGNQAAEWLHSLHTH